MPNYSAVCLLNGMKPERKLLESQISRSDCFICIDGAYNTARKFGFHPDILIGDLDSVETFPDKNCRIIRISRQDNNDFEKTLDFCLDNHLYDLRIFGFYGKRLDHFMVNMHLLKQYAPRFQRIRSWSPGEISHYLHPGYYSFKAVTGTVFSIIAQNKADHVILSGCKYPLDGKMLEVGSLGLSNEFTGNEIHLSFTSGLLLFICRHINDASD